MFDVWENHWSLEELFKDFRFNWSRMLRARIVAGLSTYPKFAVPWGLKVSMNLDESVLSEANFWELADLAGRITGVGGCRKLGYGRYAVVNISKNSGAL